MLLLAERSFFLQNSDNNSDKANGFYNRKIKSFIGELNINVPRLRYSHFDSQFLPPPYSRTYPQEYQSILLSLSGNKLLLGSYPVFGNENKGTYLSIFNNLKERGLSKPLIFVIDDFSNLKEAIKEIFPLSDKRNMPRSLIAFCDVKML